jgi:hemerythrin
MTGLDMSITIDWQQNYCVGYEQIDDQHHHFAMLINKLSDEFAKSNNEAYLQGLLKELASYARFHFISEENLMLKEDYPGYTEHREHHLKLLDAVSSKMGMISLGQTIERVDSLLKFLFDWFLQHSTNEDRQLAEYLNSRH